MQNRTSNYVMTIDPNSAADWQRVQAIRAGLRAINYSALQTEQWVRSNTKTRYRVTLKGRLGKNNPAYSLKYRGSNNPHIAIEDSQRVDVYIHKRTEFI